MLVNLLYKAMKTMIKENAAVLYLFKKATKRKILKLQIYSFFNVGRNKYSK